MLIFPLHAATFGIPPTVLGLKFPSALKQGIKILIPDLMYRVDEFETEVEICEACDRVFPNTHEVFLTWA